MSEGMTCDNCGVSVKRGQLVNWLELDRIGTSARLISDEEGPWHFDSLACLAAWSEYRKLTGFGPREAVHQGGTDT